MFFKKLNLNNYKCFQSLNGWNGINFAIPDWENIWSWLTIILGENNSWKTALLKAFTKIKDRENIFDEEKYLWQDVEIKFINSDDAEYTMRNIEGWINIDRTGELWIIYRNIDYIKENRIWVSNFNPSQELQEHSYRDNYNTERAGTDGNLSKALSYIETREEEKKQIMNSYMSMIIPSFSDWTIKWTRKHWSYIAYKMQNNEWYDIDESLGSGILSLFRIIYSLVSNTDIIIIDEPEAFLHPSGQIQLLKLILEKSKDKQIIFTTHSPYMFQKAVGSDSFIYTFTNSGTEINVKKISDEWSLFDDIDSTWGEINYLAYGIYSIEFHIDLYNYIRRKKVLEWANWKQEWIKKFDNRYFNSEQEFELIYPYDWTENSCTLFTYVRNLIHHWDDIQDDRFDALLKESTNQMIDLIKNRL